ncbi:cell adhesion molecule Dscam1-like isoform X3 [Dysidea avara]|uniref:cell adhesion molecule Dscam1-like isoform X3 n=1 Tax=Dysidea avara TaxID=196820 RepID=UPI00331E184F
MTLIFCFVITAAFSILGPTYAGGDCHFLGVKFTVGSLDHNNNCVGNIPPPSICYKTGRDSNWQCNAFLVSGYPRLEFNFSEPAVASEPRFQLNVNWSSSAVTSSKFFISNIVIKEKNNCGLYKTIDLADKGSQCLNHYSTANIEKFYCNGSTTYGLVLNATSRESKEMRLCGFDLTTGECRCEVDVSPQRGCKITPINPISLESTGGIVQYGMDNVTMNCSCSERNDAVNWFSPNGSKLYDFYTTSSGTPYVIQNDERTSSLVVIPTFSYSVFGTYTCGIRSSFPPSLMAISNLRVDRTRCIVLQPYSLTTTGEKLIYIIQTSDHIRCKCKGQNGRLIYKQPRWFFPNGDIVNDTIVNDTQYNNVPYVYYTRKRQDEIRLVIPFSNNNSYYNGIYTCGIGEDLSSPDYTATVHVIMAIKPVIMLRVMNQTYESGETAMFSCKATGEPVPLIEWYINRTEKVTPSPKYILSSPITSNYAFSTLIIFNVTLLDVGTYRCKVTNIAGKISSSGELTINDPAVITKIYSNYQTVTIYDSTLITCHAKGYPPPTFYWMLYYEVVKNDSNTVVSHYDKCSSSTFDSDCKSTSTLYIKTTLSFHNGTYRCVAINSAGNDTKSAELNVKVPFPEIKVHPKSEAVDLTETVTLTCFATGYDVSYQWKSSSGSFASKVWGINTHTLVIPDVRSSDDNTYTCVASNEGGNASSNGAKLTVTGLPEVTVTPSNQSVEVTRTAIFTTTVSGVGVKSFMYQWRHNGTIISGENGNTLVITNVMETDSGNYDCIVTNQYGDYIISEKVTLFAAMSPPVIMQDPMDVNVLLFGLAKFQCVAEGYKANITWQKHGSTLPRTSRIYIRLEDKDEIKSILEINSAVGYYAGKYCCIVGNKAGYVSSCANLTVNVPCPELISPPEKTAVQEGEVAVFYCLALSYSGLKYDWKTQDGSSLPSTAVKSFASMPYQGHLTTFYTLFIPSVKKSYNKQYCCVATNQCGDTVQCAQLIVN